MKTRIATWHSPVRNRHEAGVYFYGGEEELGLLLDGEPTKHGKRLLQQVAALPLLIEALMASGYTDVIGWHTSVCHQFGHSGCTDCCRTARKAFEAAGIKVEGT